jgi:hypothetical protein
MKTCHDCQGPNRPATGFALGLLAGSEEFDMYWTVVDGEEVLLCSGCLYRRECVARSVDAAWERNR